MKNSTKQHEQYHAHDGFYYFILATLLLLIGHESIAQSPGGVSANLAFWVKANSDVYSNAAGTTPSTDLGIVALWKDKSGNARNASQATALNQPIFNNNVAANINGNPVVTFNGVNSYLRMTATNGCLATGNNSYSVYMLVKPTVVSSPGKLMCSGTCTGSSNEFLSFDLRPTLAINDSWNMNDNISANNKYSLNQPLLLSFLYLSGGGANNQKMYLNGVSIKTRSSGTGGTGGARNNTNSNNGIGCQLSCSNEFFNGSIAELISYTNISHSGAAAQNEIESYLAIKYGLTLGNNGSTTNGYVNTSNTVIWASNTGYHNDVIGIGNETNDALDQSKSITSNLTGVLPNDVIVTANNSITSPTSMSDGQYLLMGNNGAGFSTLNSVTSFTHDGRTFNQTISRIWRAQLTGSPSGNFEIQVDMTRINSGLTLNNKVGLILDNNTIFGEGTGAEQTYQPNAGYLAIAGTLTFSIPYAHIIAAGGTAYFTIAVSASPLPVNWLSFAAKKDKENVLVTWATAQEENNSHYEVERSNNGSDFKTIHLTNSGNGNSSIKQTYFYKDAEKWTGTAYYRLKQVDFNGKYSYSNVISLNREEKPLEVALYPNPTNDLIHFSIKNSIENNNIVELQVFDIFGRIVYTHVASVNEYSDFVFSTQPLSEGNYIIKLNDPIQQKTLFMGRFNKLQ